MILSGTYVALVTPFRHRDVDEEALRALVERVIEAGVQGLVPCGTTGEGVTLRPEEADRAIRAVIEQAAGRVPVLPGTGSNDTAVALERTKRARALAAGGALVVAPYYNKPTQEGLYAHFRRVAEEGGLPVVLYDVPSRTGSTIAVETVRRLAKLNGVVAVKAACGDLVRVSSLVRACGKRAAVLSGDDILTLPICAVGGKGVVSVTANVAPRAVSDLVRAVLDDRLADARLMHHSLQDLSVALFLETNPIPVKAALAMMGQIKEELRLPLTPLSAEHREPLRRVLRDYDLL